jgi:hypothetical protein
LTYTDSPVSGIFVLWGQFTLLVFQTYSMHHFPSEISIK